VVVVIGLLGAAAVSAIYADRGSDTDSAADSDMADVGTTVPRGGQLRVGADLGQKRMIACNDGHLTLYGTGIFTVTGHCVSLTTGATRSQVSVERAVRCRRGRDAVAMSPRDAKSPVLGVFG